MSWIMTYTGTQFDLVNPTKDMVMLEDIAHALSHNCRYTGHTKVFYSVAQHCLLGRIEMEKAGLSARLQLLFMLHDATETWYNDIARPLKPLLTNYLEFEDKAMDKVWEAFKITPPTDEEWEIVKYYDNLMLYNEIPQLMPFPERFGVPELRYDGIIFKEEKPSTIKNAFMFIVSFLISKVWQEGGLTIDLEGNEKQVVHT